METIPHSKNEEATMRATVGDRLIVEGSCGAGSRRKGIVMGVEHTDGTPPYRVRWLDDGRESLVFPGPDARIVPRDRLPARR